MIYIFLITNNIYFLLSITIITFLPPKNVKFVRSSPRQSPTNRFRPTFINKKKKKKNHHIPVKAKKEKKKENILTNPRTRRPFFISMSSPVLPLPPHQLSEMASADTQLQTTPKPGKRHLKIASIPISLAYFFFSTLASFSCFSDFRGFFIY